MLIYLLRLLQMAETYTYSKSTFWTFSLSRTPFEGTVGYMLAILFYVFNWLSVKYTNAHYQQPNSLMIKKKKIVTYFLNLFGFSGFETRFRSKKNKVMLSNSDKKCCHIYKKKKIILKQRIFSISIIKRSPSKSNRYCHQYRQLTIPIGDLYFCRKKIDYFSVIVAISSQIFGGQCSQCTPVNGRTSRKFIRVNSDEFN